MPIRLDALTDNMLREQAWHLPCRAATTANITISTALNNGDTLDGVTLATGDRVLVKDQSTGSQNGIYIVGASPARAYDMLAGIQARGSFVWIISGTANGQKLYKNTNTSLPTIDTDALTFTQFSGGSGSVATDTIWDAKGDLAAGTGADTASKLSVGANDTILMADSGQATGLKWVASQTPSTQAFGDSAAEGTADTYARGDHKHAMPATPKTVSNDTLWDAKGDLAVATGADAATRLPVGSDTQVLVADSAQSTGMKWAGVSTVDPEGWTRIIKSADQDVTDAANTDDSEFQFATTSGKHYIVEMLVLTSGNNTTGDYAWRFSATAGTLDGRGAGSPNYTTGNAAETLGYAHIASASGTAVPVGVQGDLGFYNIVHIVFAFRQNTSSATVKFQFGNNSVSAGAGRTSRTAKGSIMRYRQTD